MSKKMKLIDRCYSRLWTAWSGYTGGIEDVSLKGNGDALCESVRLDYDRAAAGRKRRTAERAGRMVFRVYVYAADLF